MDNTNKQLWDNLKKIEPKLRLKYLNKGIRTGAKEVQNTAKMLVPIDDGYLRKAIKIQKITGKYKQPNMTGYVVGIDLDARNPTGTGLGVYPSVYGRIVETGSYKMAARPFLYPALVQKKDTVLQLAVSKVKEFLQGTL